MREEWYVLGFTSESSSSSSEDSEAEEEEEEGQQQAKATQEIIDYTEQATVDLRRTGGKLWSFWSRTSCINFPRATKFPTDGRVPSVYLCIMSSVNFEECVHKILSLNIREGQEKEVTLLAERSDFCYAFFSDLYDVDRLLCDGKDVQ